MVVGILGRCDLPCCFVNLDDGIFFHIADRTGITDQHTAVCGRELLMSMTVQNNIRLFMMSDRDQMIDTAFDHLRMTMSDQQFFACKSDRLHQRMVAAPVTVAPHDQKRFVREFLLNILDVTVSVTAENNGVDILDGSSVLRCRGNRKKR